MSCQIASILERSKGSTRNLVFGCSPSSSNPHVLCRVTHGCFNGREAAQKSPQSRNDQTRSFGKKSFLRYHPHLTLAECVGCDIVQADHAPEAGVAQGIFHGILVKHHGRIQEEVEEGLEKEVERRGEENTQEQVRMPMTMDGNEDTQTRLEPHVTMYA